MKRPFVCALPALGVVAAALLFAQPRVTAVWGLYVTDSAAAGREVLFLDPFPTAASCAVAARAVGTSGQWTRCRAHLSLSFFRPDRLLAFEKEFSPGGLWERDVILCGLGAKPFAPRAQSAPRTADAANAKLARTAHRDD